MGALATDLLALADGVGVRTKIMGIVIGLTLVLGLGATYELHNRMADILGTELDERAVSIARDVAARSSDLVLTNNTYGLYQLAQDTIENNPDVRYVLILGPDGVPLAHTFGDRLPAGLVEANSAGSQDRFHLELLDTEEGLIRDVAVPIFEGRAGIARVGVSPRRLNAELDQGTRDLLLMTGGVGLVGLGAAFLLTLILTRPISELVRVVRRVERGDLAARVGPRTHDEIGVLSQAFNAMAVSLERSEAKTKDYNLRLLRRNRELAALNLMASAVGQSRTLREVLDTALDRSLHLTALPAGWIWLLDYGSETLRLGAQIGLGEMERGLDGSRHLGDCACRFVLDRGAARYVEGSAGHCTLLRAGGFEGHLGIPLVSRGRALGVMNLATKQRREFSEEELVILAAIGSQIGVAIENARLWDELKRREELRTQLLDKTISAQEEERKRIARELHDETSQALTSLLVTIRVMEESSDPSDLRKRAQEARAIAGGALTAVHNLARELRPSALDHFGLAAALERYSQEYAARHRLAVDFQSIGLDGMRLPSRVETALYRIAQEALTNVARHASAQRVTVLLERRRDRVVVIVEDDGRGFDPTRIEAENVDGAGLGLFGMRERATLCGGILTIESSEGHGTAVFVEVPLDSGVPEGVSG